MAEIDIILSGLVGVILGSILSYFIQISFENYKTQRRKKFLATLFLNEIAEIKSFIDELRNKEINAINIINNSNNGINYSYVNSTKLADLINILSTNPYFTVKSNEPLKNTQKSWNHTVQMMARPIFSEGLL